MCRHICMFIFIFIFMLKLYKADGIINRLNGTEYEKLPLITYLDDYDKCMYDPKHLYCTTELELVTDAPNDLFELIQEYSARKLTHYNYSNLYRGVCVTRTCKINKEIALLDRHNVLEECLNKTLWKRYKLKARLTSTPVCYPTDEVMKVDVWDTLVAMICILVVMLNISATTYDIYCTRKTQNKDMDIGKDFLMFYFRFEGTDLFLAFSIRRNWNRLYRSDDKTSTSVKRLKCIDGLRSFMMIFIIMVHALIPMTISVNNQRFIEEIYYHLPYHMLLNAAYIVEYFFVMSSCLMSYGMERLAERRKINWTTIPSIIFKRWLRLTPPFAMVLAMVSTWSRFMGSGPLWQANVMNEIDDCRRYWLWSLMYMSNYIDGLRCMTQTWYLMVDMHLHCLGVTLIVLTRDGRWRKWILSTAFIIGIITPAIPTYIHNLATLLAVSPETLRRYAVNEPSFDYLYKRSHTNIANYVIGMTLGIYLNCWQKTKLDLSKYKKLRPLYWATVPLSIAIILSNKVFYDDGPQVNLYFRVIFQMFSRPVLAFLFAVLIVGMVFRYENFYRSIFEWDGWTWFARICYSLYISHLTIFRLIFGNTTYLMKISLLSVVPIVGITMIAIFFALILWLILEAPINEIVKICYESPGKHNEDGDKIK